MKIDDDFVTVIASQWADPIADLANAWRERTRREGYPRHLTCRDQGTCSSIILLLVVMLESFSLRAAAESDDGNALVKFFDVRKWWNRSEYSDKEDVLDLFVLRDALAHNHLYSYSLMPHAEDAQDFSLISDGNLAFRNRVKDGTLKHTSLSCNPATVSCNDVKVVSAITRNALRYLNHKVGCLGNVDFSFAKRGSTHNLWDCIDDAATTAATRIETGIASSSV